MTRPDPGPGAHNHVEGAPKASLDYVREMGTVDRREETRQALLNVFERENERMAEAAKVLPDTFTVRFTYKRKGHPRAALDSVLKGIHPSVFETEVLDA